MTRSRAAFTLLELVLALAIGVILLAALYVAVDVQFRGAQTGRESVSQSTLARSITSRVSADVSAAVNLTDGARYRLMNNVDMSTTAQQAASSSSSNGSSSTGSGSSSSSSSSASSSGSNSSSSSNSSSTTSSTTSTDAIVLPLSVQGDSTQLNLYIGKLPREALAYLGQNALSTDASMIPIVGDVRRVSYWLTSDGDSQGLARQEVPIATSLDATTNLPPGLPDESSYILAPEVKDVQFEYFDGTNWNDSWDCTTLGADGITPIGPPTAIRIHLKIETPGSTPGSPSKLKSYTSTIGILTANGTTVQQSTTGGANQ